LGGREKDLVLAVAVMCWYFCVTPGSSHSVWNNATVKM
jgi:hypothetical protein